MCREKEMETAKKNKTFIATSPDHICRIPDTKGNRRKWKRAKVRVEKDSRK